MQSHFWHLFLAQFLMLFHMVALVLLSMVAFLTIFLLAENLQQPIRIFEISGYWSCHGEQNAGYHIKEHESHDPNLVSKVTLHFLGAIYWWNKQCRWVMGTWRAPCQHKKQFKGLRQRHVSCWKERKSKAFPRQRVIELPSRQWFCQFSPPNIWLLAIP